ncbi:MAG TPA: lysylphosphatidylglycerol synthase transmembrane domain-containing protein [Chloroflexota bacterium]|nr:lysylphosphatidylglycerol synthase transmembrane domain-containing protein [Chloroflexota bacterium]
MAVFEAQATRTRPGRRPVPAAPTSAGTGRIGQLGLILRPLVSLVLLAVLFWKFGAGDVWLTLRQADPAWLAFGLAVVVIAIAISAWKWQVLLLAQGLTVPFHRLFASYLVGLFFNNFLPSNIGGDVARVHDVARYTGRGEAAAASVIGERLLAGLALALTAAAALLFNFRDAAPVAGSVTVALLLFGATVGALASARVRAALGRRFPRLQQSVFGRVAREMGTAFGNRGALVRVLALSFVFHATVVLLGWVTFVAIGAPVSLAACFLFIPIISAIQLIPVSLNGFGVREGAYVFFFGSAGLAAPQAVAASLLFALLVSVISLAGGALFALRR